MNTVCELNKCDGCMACVDACPKHAITINDSLNAYNAVIGEQCIECGLCHKMCQRNHHVELLDPVFWNQGWANDKKIRMKGSSGGLAMAIAESFIKNGGMVCSCTFVNGEFSFKIIDTITELQQFAGSKYVKSNPKGVYAEIKKRLQDNRKIFYIALPCQIAAMKNFVGKKLSENLYTADLICHGTPSPQMLNFFLKQYGLELKDLQDISFRTKGRFQIENHYKGVAASGITDRYMIAYLNSLIYTENCYNCQFAKKQRVSDITLGDSWGSELPTEEWKKGISLVLCQTEKGKKLLDDANIHLESVDLKKAIDNNHQLEYPSKRAKKRDCFFRDIKKGKKYNTLVMRYLPKKCLRQNLKYILIKLRIISGGGGRGHIG